MLLFIQTVDQKHNFGTNILFSPLNRTYHPLGVNRSAAGSHTEQKRKPRGEIFLKEGLKARRMN